MATWPELDAKVVALATFFEDNHIVYAFGGAIALAFYGEPRATIDVDVNVFVDASSAPAVIERARALGIAADAADLADARQTGQVRLVWDSTLVDLFFANDPFHDEAKTHIRSVPFGDVQIKVLGVEDLLIFKIAFNRRKDWLDLEQVLFAHKLDLGYLRRWVAEFFGDGDARLQKLDETIAQVLGPDA